MVNSWRKSNLPFDTTPTTIENPSPYLPSTPRRTSKAILQHLLARTMGFPAPRILWRRLGLGCVEFLEDLHACWSGFKSQRCRAPRSMALLDVILRHICIYRFSETGLRACFRIGRASFWQFIRLCESTQEAATIFHRSAGGRPLLHILFQPWLLCFRA